MGTETKKAHVRRAAADYFNKYLVGFGIDIGCADDVLEICHGNVRLWDYELGDGDAELMAIIPDDTYDFVYSSHCLEHVRHPEIAIQNWWRILKPEGILFVVVPDEDLYEQGFWPSKYNGGHISTWTIKKAKSWSPVSRNVVDMIDLLPNCLPLSIQRVDTGYDYELAGRSKKDQSDVAEVGIEFIFRKVA